jgi:hypothetical protein
MQVPEELKKELAALSDNFYGSIEIMFQDGLPCIIKTTKTTKIFGERNNRYGYTPR